MADPRITDARSGTAFEDGPDHGRILIAGSDTDDKYSLMEWTVAPRADADTPGGFGPHQHKAIDEVFLIRRGSVEFLLEDEVTTLVAGDVVRVPAGTRHGYRNTTAESVEMLVWFTPGGFENLFVKYRTDRPSSRGSGFLAEASRAFDTTFESTPNRNPHSTLPSID